MISKTLSKLILKLLGWKFEGQFPYHKKSVVIAVPHTSYWDFIIGRLYYSMMGLKVSFLIKKESFSFPFANILRSMGGIPVDRSKKTNMVEQLVKLFNEREYLYLTIAPEGTRQKVTYWKRGFYYIAQKANVPIVLGFIDYKKKVCGIKHIFNTSGDIEADMKKIKSYYKNVSAKYPEKFYIGKE